MSKNWEPGLCYEAGFLFFHRHPLFPAIKEERQIGYRVASLIACSIEAD